MSINQHTFFLQSGGEHLACTALLPARIKGAVLMLMPFAEERKGALPFLLQSARALHAQDIASLIPDWRGSGDSSGTFESVNPEAYRTDFNSAFACLERLCGGAPVSVLGIRLSATFLLTVANPKIRHAVLVSPVTGDEFMRQLLQRRMVNDMVAYGRARESRTELTERFDRGESVDLDGYLFSAGWSRWAQTLTGKEPLCAPLPALIIPGGHTPATARALAESLEHAEIAELRFPPFWNTVGHVELDNLVDCITARIGKDAECSGAAPSEPRLHPAAELIEVAVESRDGAGAATIRCVLDTPEGAPGAGILFLHGWSGDRTGPHRIFVQMARRLTQAGFLSLRPDFRGRGLSDGAHAEGTIASMAQDAASALAELKRRLPDGAPLCVAAICSGCKVAITLAADHPEIARLLLLSAESMGSLRSAKTDANKTKTALRTYLKKLTRPETWKKIITGRVQTGMVTKALVRHESRTRDEAADEDRTLRAFRAFRNPVHFVFGGSDPDAPGSQAAYREYCEKHGIPHSLHLIPHASHSFYSVEWTQEVLQRSLEFLTQAGR